MKHDAMEILQRFVEAEICIDIVTKTKFYNHHIRVALMDELGSETLNYYWTTSFDDGIEWLANESIKYFPHSEFAKWWNNLRVEQGLDVPGFSIPVTFEEEKNDEQD
jgi:hypothetical protein